MKSERAKEHIARKVFSIDNDAFLPPIITRDNCNKAVELAEQEMINKASKAYCFCRCGVASCIMKQVGRDDCKELREFKQKLTER